jgi:hypothetical protein
VSNVREALCKFLQADTGAGKLMEIATQVYPGQPPEGAEHPLVDVTAMRAPRGNYAFQGLSHEDSLYLVKAVDKNASPATAAEMAKRIRARLDPDGTGDAEISVEGSDTLLLSWVQAVEYDDPQGDGSVYRHEGGIYEVWTEPE